MAIHCFPHRIHAQHGVAAVEFAPLAVILFSFIFGTIEISRVLFVWSTMTEVTNRAARAAAMVRLDDGTPIDTARQSAMFVNTPGEKMILGGDIDPSYLRLDYLQSDAATPASPMPSSPEENAAVCRSNPANPSCTRFVRVRLCLPATNCVRVPYAPLALLPGINSMRIAVPYFTAIAPVETAGAYVPSP